MRVIGKTLDDLIKFQTIILRKTDDWQKLDDKIKKATYLKKFPKVS